MPEESDVLVFITDAAPYMIKAYNENLKGIFNKMIHVTCVCHGLHRVADALRLSLPTADSFIANCKKVFRKSPKNLAYFKNYAPTLPLPPRPVVTRWGTWLQAGLYFAQHMEVLNELLPNLPSSTAASTKIIDILENKRPQLESELAIIMFHYKTLVTVIDELQGYMTLPAALEKLKKVESTLTHPVGFENYNM